MLKYIALFLVYFQYTCTQPTTSQLDVCFNDMTSSDHHCWYSSITQLQQQLTAIKDEMSSNPLQKGSNLPRDCADIYTSGVKTNGIYTIYPKSLDKAIKVFCDLTGNGGGWTVIQRRKDGSVSFNRDWKTYKQGFGDLNGELWLGNDYISAITTQNAYKLYIHLVDFEGNSRYATYKIFSVEPEYHFYRLHLGPYEGNAGDSFSYNNHMKFSTYDFDNDEATGLREDNCAKLFNGGFWFKSCFEAGLTLPYRTTSVIITPWHGNVWKTWLGSSYSLKETTMKIKPLHFSD